NGSFDSGDRFSSSMFHPTSPLRGQIAGYIVGYLSSSPGVEPTPGKGFDQDSDSFLDDLRHGFFQRLPTAGLPTDQELIDQLIPYLNLDATPNPISESGGFIQVQ
ncbi:MAG: hypothetical protein O3C21_19275, partial [Verrucomicrobia bacterium]|nr:hypothetical protein [Verrucomicrobiota bacterium]